ncbi:MAG: hypothetical protein AAF533_16415 [Acidobacteriota bacterium]
MSRRSLAVTGVLLSVCLAAPHLGQAQPPNDDCAGALPLTFPSLNPGETCTASPSFNLPSVCGDYLALFDGDVWFTFVGTDQEVRVSTCDEFGGGATFDTQLVVTSGSCTDPVLDCVDGDDNSGVICSTVQFCAEAGVTYHVVVTGFLSCGDFTLAAEELGPCQGCDSAERVDVPSRTAGTTIDARAPILPACCSEDEGGVFSTSPATWYSVIGTGRSFTASTCPDLGGSAELDTRLTVYCGSCDGPTCVGVNDDDLACSPGSRLTSTVSWCTQPDTEYLIQVHGLGFSAGDFVLALEEGSGCFDAYPCRVPEPPDACPDCDVFQLLRLADPGAPPVDPGHPCADAPPPTATTECCDLVETLLALLSGAPTELPPWHPCPSRRRLPPPDGLDDLDRRRR